jgi:ribonucleoside-diphosphate reductase alpha chain
MVCSKLDNCGVKIKTQCGNMFVQINHNNGSPVKLVNVSLGKQGNCVNAFFHTMCELINLSISKGVTKEEIIKILRGVSCPRPKPGPRGFKSCIDGLGKELEQFEVE